MRKGRGLEFVNRDAGRTIFHTVTACKAPPNRTPTSLKPGKYTYFCRVHPFMRGAFEVKRRKR